MLQVNVHTSCDVLEYRNLTMRPVFTDWLMTSQVTWHLLNEVNRIIVSNKTIWCDSCFKHLCTQSYCYCQSWHTPMRPGLYSPPT